jgi:hypothetical protein
MAKRGAPVGNDNAKGGMGGMFQKALAPKRVSMTINPRSVGKTLGKVAKYTGVAGVGAAAGAGYMAYQVGKGFMR